MQTEGNYHYARPKTGRYVLLSLLAVAVAVGATLGYRYLFMRRGEGAAVYLPKNLQVMVTLDTNPSPNQQAAFQKLSSMLKEHGGDEKLEELMSEMFDKAPVAKEVRPHLRHNFAFGVWEGKNQRSQVALLCDVDDAKAVETILAKYGKAPSGDTKAYTFPDSSVNTAVIKDYLVLSSSLEGLETVRQLSEGKGESIVTLSAYQEARSSLPEDENLMVFVSPDAMKSMRNSGGMEVMNGTDWFAMGVSLNNDGMAMHFHVPLSTGNSPILRTIAEMRPLTPASSDKLPQGAYGIYGIAQPGKLLDGLIRESAKSGTPPDILQFEKDTGLSFQRNVIDGLAGNTYCAFYPAPNGLEHGADLLVVFDDANGGDASPLADGLRAFAERDPNSKMHFASSQYNGVTIWQLDEQTAHEMRSSLDQEFGFSNGGVDQSGYSAQSPELSEFMANKTLAYAVVGKSVYVATSRALLERAIDSASSGSGTLRGQPLAATVANAGADASKLVVVLAVGKIVKDLQPKIQESMRDVPEEARPYVQQILDSVSENDLQTIQLSYDGRVLRASMVAPIGPTLALPAAILFPVFAQAKVAAKSAATVSNAKQVVLGVLMYAAEHDDKFPTAGNFDQLKAEIMPYVKNEPVFHPIRPGVEFVWNRRVSGGNSMAVTSPAELPLIWESAPDERQMRIVAFADGHVKKMPDEEFQRLSLNP